MFTTRSVRSGLPWLVVCVATLVALPIALGQEEDSRRGRDGEGRRGEQERPDRGPREGRGRLDRRPGAPPDAELEQATERLSREIEILSLRLEMAKSQLQMIQAQRRLRAIGAGDGGEDRLSIEDVQRSTIPFPDTRFIDRPARRGPDREPPDDLPEVRRDEPRRPRPSDREARRALDRKVVIPFPDPTSLEEVIKYLKRSTADDALPNGIAIYIDPRGLHKAGQSMESKVTLKAEDVPLKDSLNKILSQIGLTFDVKDGVIAITSKESPAEDDDKSVDDDGDDDDKSVDGDDDPDPSE